MKRWFAIAVSAAALAACATPTVFAPMTRPGGTGYSETRIQSDRYRITFRGGSDADQNRVDELALLRAAQVTLDAGCDWFSIVSRYGEAQPPRGPTLSVGGGTASWGRHSGSSFGMGVGGIPLGGGPILDETIEIVLSKGTPPRGAPNAYDAHDIVRSIRP
jgi:hypothetical protein